MSDKMSYEEGLSQLEQIVESLENGEITLDESFKAYQKGVKLYRRLKAILDEGDARIEELTKENAEAGQDADA